MERGLGGAREVPVLRGNLVRARGISHSDMIEMLQVMFAICVTVRMAVKYIEHGARGLCISISRART